MPAVPVPPVDGSGGLMVIQYTNGTDTHRLRLHVSPFNYGSGTNWVYNPVVGSGAEADLATTFANLCALIKVAYPTSWTFSLLAVASIVSGVPVERFGWPVPSTVAGTNGTAVPADQSRASMENFNFKTLGGGRARLVLIGSSWSRGANDLAAPYVPTSGNDPGAYAVAQYLQGANCAIVGHDGQKLSAYGPRLTYCVNRRLRRRYGFA